MLIATTAVYSGAIAGDGSDVSSPAQHFILFSGASMLRNLFVVGLLGAVYTGSALAQVACPCAAGGVRTADSAALATLISNKMACAVLGDEMWQEWHNGSGSGGGPVIDYKKGPSDPVDPSETVGTYVVGSDNTITYTYGSSSYKYAVCSTAGSYAFCGAPYGGRDITNVKIGGSGLQSCATVPN